MQRIDVEQVMKAAADAFAMHGMSGVGMREISRQSGVSLPTIYYYFGSKEKLFEAVCDDLYDRALQTVRASVSLDVPTDAPLAPQLTTLCEQLFTMLTTNRTLFLLLRQDLIHGSRNGADFRSRYQYEGLIELFRRLLVRRHPPDAAQRLAFLCAAMIFGYCEFAVVSNRVGDGCDELARALSTLAQ